MARSDWGLRWGLRNASAATLALSYHSLCLSELFSFFTILLYLFFKVYLNNLHTQHGAQTHDPEIKSHALLQLSQPGVPVFYF